MRYFLHLAYRGNRYRGWQRQPKVRSVQEVLEKCLSQVMRREVNLIGCGRTDAEVHASSYYAHFNQEVELPERFLFKVNRTLPDDIAVFKVFTLAENYHARFSAFRRTYDYYLHRTKDPFRDKLSTYLQAEDISLDKEAMQAAASILPKYKDFLSFCKVPEKHDSTKCELYSAEFFFEEEPGHIRFRISANRFLRGMVRLIVAQLLEVGRGRVSVAEFERRVAAGERAEFFISAPPQGLYLSEVAYPFFGEEEVIESIV